MLTLVDPYLLPAVGNAQLILAQDEAPFRANAKHMWILTLPLSQEMQSIPVRKTLKYISDEDLRLNLVHRQ